MAVTRGCDRHWALKAREEITNQAFVKCSGKLGQKSCESANVEARSLLAAESAVRVSVWQTVFNFFGLIGLAMTVLYARNAWIAARDSARADNDNLELTKEALKEQRAEAAEQDRRFAAQLDASRQLAYAANRQANIMRSQSETQLRAYLSVFLAEIRGLEIGGQPQAHVAIKNCGTTPASEMRSWVGIGLGPHDPAEKYPAKPDKFPDSGGTIGPGQEKHLTVRLSSPITTDIASQLENGTVCIRVIGGAEYVDVFGKKRETLFNLTYGGPYELNENCVLIAEPTGNLAT